MAEIPRLQSGRVQVQGVSNLPQPNLNFGQQRPEIEFQTAGESASVLSRTLSNLSTQMFGQSQQMADVAGARFVAENPITQDELNAMANGNTEKFKQDFSLNAFGAAVNKFRANEISAHAELEIIKKANAIQLQIETGRDANGNPYNLDVTKIASDWNAATNGFSNVLAQISPDASYKFRATAAVHGNKLLLAATKAQNQKKFTENKVKIVADVQEYTNSISSILKGEKVFLGKDGRNLTINEMLVAEREALLGRALVLGGLDGQTFAFEESNKIELEVKTAVFENAILYRKGDLGGDLVSFNDKVRNRTLPDDLQAVWDSMSLPQQKAARDKIVSQYQQLIDIKAKDREIDRQENINLSNKLKLQYLDKNTSDETRAELIDRLKDISLKYPEIIDAKTIYEMPKMLKETAEDNYSGVAKLTERLRNKDPLLDTPEKILEAAVALNVTPKTALELSEKFLPKNAREVKYLSDTIEIEYLLRTKFNDPLTKKPIKTLEDLKNSLSLRKLSLADAPNNYIQLLTAPPEAGDDDIDAVAKIVKAIDDNVLLDAVSVANAAKGKRIRPETLNSLIKRPGDRMLQLQASADRIGGRIADASSKNPTTQADIRLQSSEEIMLEHEKMMADWKQKGSVGPAPTINDAGRVVEKRNLDRIETKKVEAAQQSLISNFGPNGSMMPEEAKKAKINLPAIQPKFKPGANVEVTDEYRRALIAPFEKAGIEKRVYEPIVNEVIQQQVIIEKTSRSRRNK